MHKSRNLQAGPCSDRHQEPIATAIAAHVARIALPGAVQ